MADSLFGNIAETAAGVTREITPAIADGVNGISAQISEVIGQVVGSLNEIVTAEVTAASDDSTIVDAISEQEMDTEIDSFDAEADTNVEATIDADGTIVGSQSDGTHHDDAGTE